MDPRFAAKTTFGRMSFKENPDGTYTYNDQFDYNDAKEGGFEAFKEDLKNNPKLTMYQKLRKAGTFFFLSITRDTVFHSVFGYIAT